MAGSIDRTPDGADVAGDARGGFILHDHHGADFMRLVCRQSCVDSLRRSTGAPGFLENLHIEAVALCEVDPEMAELAEARCKNTVARAQRVHQHRFPRAGAGGWEDERLAGRGLEELLQPLEKRQGKLREYRAAVILHRPVHGVEDAVRHVGRSGNMKEVTARHV